MKVAIVGVVIMVFTVFIAVLGMADVWTYLGVNKVVYVIDISLLVGGFVTGLVGIVLAVVKGK